MKRICQDVTNVTNEYLRSVAVQAISEPEICHVAGIILRIGARVRMHILAGFVMGAGCRKNHDKQLTHIVRVSISGWLYDCHDAVILMTIKEL